MRRNLKIAFLMDPLETLDLIDNSLFEEEETWLLEHFKDVLISDFDDDYDYE